MRAWAHGGAGPPGAADGSSAWALDPLVLLPLGIALYLYSRGLAGSWQRAGAGRGVKRWEAAAFSAGMAGLFFALVWPLEAIGEQLFSAHMAQHLLLMNIAAPLLVLGAPLQVMMRPLPRRWQRVLAMLLRARAWAWLTGAAAATLVQQAVLWAWHAPRAIAAALASDVLHILMHASLLAVALIFWSAVLRPRSGEYWKPIAALLATLKASGIVCIVLLIRPGAHYLAYGEAAAAWGLSPAQDEQLGWGLMMIVVTLSSLAAALWLFALSFRRLERPHALR